MALIVLLAGFAALKDRAFAQQQRREPPKPGPMLEQGSITLDTPDFELSLVRSSQTVAALKPKGANGFDFTPGDLLVQRSQNGYYHLGDIDLRLRKAGTTEWKDYSTAARRTAVIDLTAQTGAAASMANEHGQDAHATILAAADLSPTLPADIPLQVTRIWALDRGKLILRFTLKNKSTDAVEVGALGIPMIFNNVLNDRTLEQAHTICSFYDPYIGEDAGYLQVTRLNGHGPTLLVVPDGRTPFEAYKPILNAWRSRTVPIFTDPTPRGITFEGFYDWMVHTQAFAENEWKNAQQWNPPTFLKLAPGESKFYGVKFLVADQIRDIEKILIANRRPVAVGIPGYVLPMDIDARLFLKYSRNVKSVQVEPQGAITISANKITRGGWKAYTLRGKTWGRTRLVVTYQDGLVQAIHYDVIKPASEAVADMGHFLTTKQWFQDPNDPFHRSPSVISFDRDTNQMVTQDSRVWVAGLSDEGGAGSWLAAMMKELGEPSTEETAKLQQFVDGVLWGGLQYKDGPRQYGVRKSLFYYQPDEMPPNYYRSDLNWKSWTSWNKEASAVVDRSYNYPHVAAAYWVLYRLARNDDGLITNHLWDWYLTRAYETSLAMNKYAPGLARFGQMEGDIFLQILLDLQREGWSEQATQIESEMRKRADVWRQEKYPFGSEMPWDSTGQEEVYAWTKYFGDEQKAQVTLDAILGYMPTVPHWGYNGSARRYWDFIYAGKTQRLERQLHHYGSGINAIPVLAEYREHPDDLYLLRVGYGGAMGALTDIDQEGFASCAFHSFPDMLKFDAYTADNGPNFYGHAMTTATYLVQHPEFGWLAFGGNVRVEKGVVKATPLDSFRTRIYVAPHGLWLTLDAGQFEALELNSKSGKLRVALAPATDFSPAARLRIEQPAKLPGAALYHPAGEFKLERGAFVIPLSKGIIWVELGASQTATVHSAERFDVSPPLASLRAAVDADDSPDCEGTGCGTSPGNSESAQTTAAPSVAASLPAASVAAEQTTQGRRPALPVIESFDGLGAGFSGPNGTARFRNPSDNSLAVGPDHIVQIVNSRFAVFTKKGSRYESSGKVLYGPVPTNAIFAGMGGVCEARNNGDAVVRFDQLAGRWLIVMPIFSGIAPGEFGTPSKPPLPGQLAPSGQPAASGPAVAPPANPPPPKPYTRRAPANSSPGTANAPPRTFAMCYAVSVGPDPLGAYYRYAFERKLFPDYARPAVWPDGYYVATSTGDDVIQKHVCIADRTRMLAGLPATEQCVVIDGVNFLNNADIEGHSLPWPGTPNIMMAAGGTQLKKVFDDDGVFAWKVHVDWAMPANTRLIGPVKIPVAPYHYLCDGQLTKCVPQPNTDRRLDVQGDKIMQRLVYRRVGRHGVIVAAHSVTTSAGAGGVRWYEFRLNKHGDPQLNQQGTYAPDGFYRWMPSIAIDKKGDIGVGYSFGGTPNFPGQRFAGRRAHDPKGLLSFHESLLADGEAAQTDAYRWEDYTTTAMDPSDDCTFWYVGDYFRKGDTSYRTRIGSFLVPGCKSALR